MKTFAKILALVSMVASIAALIFGDVERATYLAVVAVLLNQDAA